MSVGVPPDSLSASFLLSANTNYLAWRFRGFDVPDRLKFTFYGSSYGNNPIVVENIVVGSTLSTINLDPNSIPKSADTPFFYAKVACLTGFTISEGDYITIEITPNPTNNNTKWDFYFKCLETFDCTSCMDNHQNSPYKIVTSSLNPILTNCNRVQINVTVTGCSENQLSDSDKYKYFNTDINSLCTYNTSFSPIYSNNTFYFENTVCAVVLINTPGINLSCSPSSNSTIIYSKSIINNQGVINLKFSSISDFNHYYNSYTTIINLSGIFTDNTQYNFYRCFYLKIPVPQNVNEICGDTTIPITYAIHPTSIVTTGFTNGMYEINLTMPTITQGLFPTNCQLNCNSSIVDVIYAVNQSSLSTTNNYNATTQVGSKYQTPFFKVNFVQITNNVQSGGTFVGNFKITQYANQTIPYSGNSNTLIPSLSALTCDFLNNSVTLGSPSFVQHYQYLYYYRIELFDLQDITNFRIYGSPITNFRYSGATIQNNWQPIYELALEYSGGTITYQNPYYCI